MTTLEVIAANLDERLPHPWRALYVTEGVYRPRISIFPVGQQRGGKLTISLDDFSQTCEGFTLHLTYPERHSVVSVTEIRDYDLRDPTSLYRLDEDLVHAGVPLAGAVT